MKVALDAMGGDLAPKAVVEGGVLAALDFGVEVVLVGDREIVSRELGEHDQRGASIRVEHAPETITMDDSPLEAVIAKPHSSISVGLELVRNGQCDAFVSAGNSGAVMVAASAVLGPLSGVDRPAIASIIPTSQGFALLIDAGANTEVKAANLVQFAVMGSVYWKRVRGVQRPRIGILANGEEASKGTDLTRAAAATLGEFPQLINYRGYVEGRDINRGKADVIVTDGFTGNAVLKTMEGFAPFMLGKLREVLGGSWRGRFAYLLVRKQLRAMVERLDPHEYGGAPLLGVNGITVIAHGSSNPRAIRNAVRAAADEALVHQVNLEISDVLAKIQVAAPAAAKPQSKGIRALVGRLRERLHRRSREGEDDAHLGELAADSARGHETGELRGTQGLANQAPASTNGVALGGEHAADKSPVAKPAAPIDPAAPTKTS